MNYFNSVHQATRAAFSILYLDQALKEKEPTKTALLFQKVWGGREIGKLNSRELANYHNRFLNLLSVEIPQETIASFLTLSECFALSEVSRKTRNVVLERLNPKELIRDWAALCQQIEAEVERTSIAPMGVPPFCKERLSEFAMLK